MSAGRFVQDTRTRLREGILDATERLVLDGGWSSVTMAAVAERVGVSRQTVYNDVGGKDALGEALVLRELEGFLEVVGGDLRRMRVALVSRGFRARDPRHWPALAGALGALFIRSYERGERVHLAMISRGHGVAAPPGQRP